MSRKGHLPDGGQSWTKGHQPAPTVCQLLAEAKEQGGRQEGGGLPQLPGVLGWLPRVCPGEPGEFCPRSTGAGVIDMS